MPRIWGPFSATTGRIRQNTPMGERRRMMSMTFMQTSVRLSTSAAAGRPFSPAARMPKPNSSAATITCSMEALAKGAMMLEGKMSTSVSMKLAVSPGSKVTPVGSMTVKKPLNRLARNMASTMAPAVVQV